MDVDPRVCQCVIDRWEKLTGNVKEKLDIFKTLLTTVVDDSKTLHEKIDIPWDSINRFGGDRHIAKKIISLFYPEKVFPIFNTRHFEFFSSKLGLDLHRIMKKRFQKDYEDATVGEKFEAFNEALLEWKEKNSPSLDNLVLAASARSHSQPACRD
jgi:hypothetical protein